MDDIRWKEEREEIIELIYRVQVDHDNSLPESEVDELCPWVGAAHRKASRQLTSAYASQTLRQGLTYVSKIWPQGELGSPTGAPTDSQYG